VVVVDDGERGRMHVFVLLRVQVVAAGELQADLVGWRFQVGFHARLVAQHAVMGHDQVWPVDRVDRDHLVRLTLQAQPPDDDIEVHFARNKLCKMRRLCRY
jgi:hypothetical protein